MCQKNRSFKRSFGPANRVGEKTFERFVSSAKKRLSDLSERLGKPFLPRQSCSVKERRAGLLARIASPSRPSHVHDNLQLRRSRFNTSSGAFDNPLSSLDRRYRLSRRGSQPASPWFAANTNTPACASDICSCSITLLHAFIGSSNSSLVTQNLCTLDRCHVLMSNITLSLQRSCACLSCYVLCADVFSISRLSCSRPYESICLRLQC
jgi:hypothetical protein